MYATISGGYIDLYAGGLKYVHLDSYSGASYFNGPGYFGLGTTKPTSRLNVVGDMNVTGNFTGNQIYGEMWNYTANETAWTFAIGLQDVYYNLTGLAADRLNGFSYTDGGATAGGSFLTTEINGLYKTDLAVSFEGTANNKLYAFSIAKNHIQSSSRQCYNRRFVSVSAIVGSVTISCLLPLVNGDKVVVQIENENGASDVKIHTVNLNLMRIGD